MAIRIKKSVCVGLDVHRNNVWACVCAKDPNKKKDTLVFKTKKFLSNHTDLTEMCNWIKETTEKILGKQVTESIDVYMESTGKYSTPVYDVCEQNKTKPHIVNPKHVRTIAGQKTDQKDCAWIAELGINGLLRESYIPEKAIRASRRLSRSRTNILHAKQDDVRRIQNVLTEANIRMDLIFTSIDGESARKVIEYLMETDEPKLGEIKRRIRKSCRIMKYESVEESKKKEEELLKAFSGAKFSPEQKFELRKAYERIDSYNAQIRDYETMMNETLLPFKSYLDLLESVPGISRLSAMQILSEIGPDIEPFQIQN
ncbi:IS110 family transposase [Allobaculum sp. JKK-2023]|uniref:IS110 family transposase n=1 Tax=Allobaculum sp. JKK-2023 TaxID=3108943 RepID=UPI002B05292D|nr:transposase [Allobaculum sp. JKK-2023]